MNHMRFVLAGAAGAIAGLLAYGLVPSYSLLWGIGAGAAVVVAVLVVSALLVRDEDRDPTIRPPNLPYDDHR